MLLKKNRILREQRTIEVMTGMYCRAHHTSYGRHCPECRNLLNYALICIDRCPFKADKPACLKCPVHCYKPHMREKIRKVMRYAGPRMIIRHPVLSLLHFLDGRTSHRNSPAGSG
jgi:hypothetical protein